MWEMGKKGEKRGKTGGGKGSRPGEKGLGLFWGHQGAQPGLGFASSREFWWRERRLGGPGSVGGGPQLLQAAPAQLGRVGALPGLGAFGPILLVLSARWGRIGGSGGS